ncbi:hypothetical protein COLO4_20005 [Corchorus olitorius]|uniref:Uncharacterized protein n=1 Tax=Corchorus olitorius TaxID=93759 RepID=A0A1R3J2F0_9ROSI|nr:hypothetical protein COLO4_20005 [Corchorus olitorius]
MVVSVQDCCSSSPQLIFSFICVRKAAMAGVGTRKATLMTDF